MPKREQFSQSRNNDTSVSDATLGRRFVSGQLPPLISADHAAPGPESTIRLREISGNVSDITTPKSAKEYRSALAGALRNIFDGIEALRELSDQRRKFTIDGRLVGDLGEFVASMEYALDLDTTSKPGYDGTTSDGRRVQIKATFQDSLTYRSECDLYLGIRLRADGTYEEIYNGPGRLIYDHYKHRKGIGSELLSFPIAKLQELAKLVPKELRIPPRAR